jgi:hypothetical protein
MKPMDNDQTAGTPDGGLEDLTAAFAAEIAASQAAETLVSELSKALAEAISYERGRRDGRKEASDEIEQLRAELSLLKGTAHD